MPRWSRAALVAVASSLGLTFLFAVPPDAAKDAVKTNVDADKARAAIGVPAGMKAELWAAEPLMMNPVAFCFDEKGRAYVAESSRFGKGVPDTRGFMYWMEEDIGSRSVEDRLAMYAKHKYGSKDKDFTEYDDQVRMVWDSTGKGYADKSTVFSNGYNQLKDGLMAGVLARKGSVYVTNIPDVYKLTDTKGEGVADKKESLATGFGVRAQFVGHDLHGLRMGPDGKLYFSIGDRGLNVTTIDKKKLFLPDEGAVLRCDPDGKNMEIVHRGLRNPQELAFDDLGNLFTYDNNCDSGDRARWVQIVEGGDSGWRCGYQYGTLMHTPSVPQGNRGPWNTEKLWELPHAESAAYVVPPLKHFGNGPAGMTHYPGIGLNEKYKDHFFACDFTSNPGGSKIWDVSVKPKGASFEVTEKVFISNMVPTDCEFGPDGAFYFSDWVGGWEPPGKGRIFRVVDPEAMKDPAVAEAKKLLADGIEKLKIKDWAKLLEHPHQQVRQEAQYELAAEKESTELLVQIAGQSKNKLARLHAIWALAMKKEIKPILGLVDEKDVDIRVALAKALRNDDRKGVWEMNGRERSMNDYALRVATKLLGDANARVQAEAAVSFGALIPTAFERKEEVLLEVLPSSEQAKFTPLFDLLKTNADKDVYLRQAAVQGLVTMTKNPEDLYRVWKSLKDYDLPSVRMGVVLALRRMESKKLDEFLKDGEPKIALEAARAIHDLNLMEPMVALAKLLGEANIQENITFRAISANFKLGSPANAVALANYAAKPGEADYLRSAALKLLGEWAKPSKRDGITGLRQDLKDRDALVAIEALKPVLAKVFSGSPVVRREAAEMAKKLGLTDAGPLLLGLVTDDKQAANLRVEALYALDELKSQELKLALKTSADSKEPKLRGAALIVDAKRDPSAASKELPRLLKKAETIVEKQMIFEALGKMPESQDVDESLAEWLIVYSESKLPPELMLDLIEASKARAENDKLKLHAPLRELLKKIDVAARAAEAKDHLSRNRNSLMGGDALKGRDHFLNNAAVYCQRCHKLDNQGGEVGPPLNGLGKEKTREYLLESITHPSKQIAKGYEAVQLTLLDGKQVSGVLKSKDAKEYVVMTPEAKLIRVPVADVDVERPDKSAMPEDLVKKLSLRELRDLVEFLSGLKDK